MLLKKGHGIQMENQTTRDISTAWNVVLHWFGNELTDKRSQMGDALSKHRA